MNGQAAPQRLGRLPQGRAKVVRSVVAWFRAETFRPVVSTLGLLAVIAGTRWFLMIGADSTPASDRFASGVDFHVWVLLVSITVALWVAIALGLLRAIVDVFGSRDGRSPGAVFGPDDRRAIGWTLLGYPLIVLTVIAALRSGDGGPVNPLHASHIKIPVVVVTVLILAWPAILGLWWSHARLSRFEHGLPLSPPVARESFGDGDGEVDEVAAATAADAQRRARWAGELLGLRRLILRILTAVSVGISAAVLSSGALRNALLADGAAPASFPSHWVLLYGAFFSGVFALVFVPAFLEWRGVAARLVDDAFPIPSNGIPTKEWHEGREQVSGMLGLNVSPLRVLGPLLGVLGPALTSLVALLVPELAG